MNIWAELLTAMIRHLVTALVGALVAHGIIQASEMGHYTSGLTTDIVAGILIFLATYGASAWNKIKASNRFIFALHARPSSSPAVVVATADAAPASEKIALATKAHE